MGPGSPTGLNAVKVSVDGHGAAVGNAILARVFQLNSVEPTSGSQAGQLRRQPNRPQQADIPLPMPLPAHPCIPAASWLLFRMKLSVFAAMPAPLQIRHAAAGGTILRLQGLGLPSNITQGLSIQFPGVPGASCAILNGSTTNLTCITAAALPASSDAGTSRGSISLVHHRVTADSQPQTQQEAAVSLQALAEAAATAASLPAWAAALSASPSTGAGTAVADLLQTGATYVAGRDSPFVEPNTLPAPSTTSIVVQPGAETEAELLAAASDASSPSAAPAEAPAAASSFAGSISAAAPAGSTATTQPAATSAPSSPADGSGSQSLIDGRRLQQAPPMDRDADRGQLWQGQGQQRHLLQQTAAGPTFLFAAAATPQAGQVSPGSSPPGGSINIGLTNLLTGTAPTAVDVRLLQAQAGAAPPSWADFQQLPQCAVQAVSSTAVTCTLPNTIMGGSYAAVVRVDPVGFAVQMPSFTVQPVITSISPSQGEWCSLCAVHMKHTVLHAEATSSRCRSPHHRSPLCSAVSTGPARCWASPQMPCRRLSGRAPTDNLRPRVCERHLQPHGAGGGPALCSAGCLCLQHHLQGSSGCPGAGSSCTGDLPKQSRLAHKGL